MRVDPSTTQCKQYTEPFSSAEDLSFAVPAYAQNQDGLEMANNVEGQGTRPSNDQELTQVVHGRHDAGCQHTPEDIGGYGGKIGKSVEKRDKGNKKTDGNGRLVEEKLWWGDGKVLDLLANPDLVQGSAAESQGCDDNTKKLSLGSLIDGEGNSNACRQNGSQHVSRDVFSEEDEVDKDDSRRSHDLGELVETDRVEGQAEVAKNNIAGEEATDRQHLPDVELDGLESVKGPESGNEEDETGRGKMPHDNHKLACFQLLVAEHSARLLVNRSPPQSALIIAHTVYSGRSTPGSRACLARSRNTLSACL